MDSQRITNAICEADDRVKSRRDAAVQVFTRVSALSGQLSLLVDFEANPAKIRATLALLTLEMNRVNEFSLWLDHELSGAKPQ